jgi:hypothetical protein
VVKQNKATLEHHMQSYETIKGERYLLKTNQEREDVNYWALKKNSVDLEIRSTTLQRNKESLQ